MIEKIYMQYEFEIKDKNFIASTLKPMKDSFVSSDEVSA